ncbi:MAG: HAD family hydrolase [Pseudomonadota bacterium]
MSWKLVGSSVAAILLATPALADPLPSWESSDSKTQIVEFVESVTDPDSPTYVTPAERIAVFDNDGTLWGEQPLYFQLIYAIERLQEKAKADPSILTSDALVAASKGDLKGVLASGKEGLLEVLAVSHSGMTVEDFQADVSEWLATATHPKTGKPYGEMVYQPMLELLTYLQDEGFETWIVSGGGIHFIRAFAEEAYGIPPEQVVGSAAPTQYDADQQVVMKLPGIEFVDDKAGKPVGIDSHIGRRPIFAGGNSDGDFEMLEYTMAGEGARFAMIVHHTDQEREYAYDRGSPIGGLERGLDESAQRGWLLVDMAKDWKTVFAD